MNLSKLLGPIVLIFAFNTMVGLNAPIHEISLERQSSRVPASVATDCYKSIKLFLGKRPLLTKVWNKLKVILSGHKIDYKKLETLREEYKIIYAEKNLNFNQVDPSSEGLLAYIETINKSIGGSNVPDPVNLNFLRRRKIASIVEMMSSDGKLLMNDIESLVGELYVTAYGPSMKANEILFSDNIEKRVLARVIQEDLTSRGLSHVFMKYKVFQKKKSWAQKFVRSNLGRSLGVAIMNFPVAFGLPPIYLPKLKPLKIPESLVSDLIIHGLTDEMVVKLEQEIGRQLGDKLTFNLQNRARYRLFRRYYMMGISIYLTYMAVVEFQVTNQNLNNEAEILDDLAGELTSTLEDAMDLESRGYDIFKKTDGIQSQIKDEVHWCKSLKQCFASEAEDLGVPVERGTDSYQACKDFIDPENLCPSL